MDMEHEHKSSFCCCKSLESGGCVLHTLSSTDGKEFACNAGDPNSIPGSGRSTGEGIGYTLHYSWASLVAQMVKNPPAMQETWIWSLVGKIPGEGKGYPLQYSCLENSMDKGTWKATVHGATELDTNERLTHTQLEEKFDQGRTVRKAESRSGYRWQLLFMTLHNSAEQVLTNLSCLKLIVITWWLLYLKKSKI